MIIDCHAHLDPRALTPEALIRKMDRHGVGRVALISRMTETIEPQKSFVLLSMQRILMNSRLFNPVAETVSRSFYDETGNLRSLWRPFTKNWQGYVKSMMPDNESVAAAVRRFPDRFWGWICLNPKEQPNALDDLEKWRSVPGMIGVKAHPYWHHFSVRSLDAIARRSEELGLPMLIHLGFGSQGEYRWLIETFPRLNIIFAHAGIPHYQALWPLVRSSRNAYVDLSSPHLSESFVRGVVRILGPEKCLYGTDSPYGFEEPDGTYDYGAVKGWMDRLPVSDPARASILGGNFLRLIRV